MFDKQLSREIYGTYQQLETKEEKKFNALPQK